MTDTQHELNPENHAERVRVHKGAMIQSMAEADKGRSREGKLKTLSI